MIPNDIERPRKGKHLPEVLTKEDEGQKGGPYSYTSARQVMKRAVAKANLSNKVSLHTLRHSYATHLLQSGTDLRYIQEILGHASPKTTMLYTHVAANDLKNIKSPFDELDL